MAMTEEMKQMLDIIKKYDKAKTGYKKYYAPDIPDKILKKIIKNFDSNVPVNSIVAFFDITVFNSCKDGWLFTVDGMYDKFLGKPHYIRYCDIIKVSYDKEYPLLQVRNENSEYRIQHGIDDKVAFTHMIYELRDIDKEYGQSTARTSGKVKKLEIPEDMKKKCHTIIHSAATGAGAVGAGLAQAVATDNAVIVPIQITMITTMGKQVFDLDITEAMAKSIIASAGATIAGRTASQFLVGWIPGIGNAINTATAAGITEVIGWIAANDFYNRWLQDQNKGKIAGMKIGYEAASAEYENKLRKQAEMFLKEKENVETMKNEYEKLLDEYEKHIEKLEAENASLLKIAELREELDKLRELKKEN